jgi:hypothetical protein
MHLERRHTHRYRFVASPEIVESSSVGTAARIVDIGISGAYLTMTNLISFPRRRQSLVKIRTRTELSSPAEPSHI